MAKSGKFKERNLIAFLGGLSLFLSVLEYLIPKPVPFLRLGIANIPLMVGMTLLSPKDTIRLALVKIIGQALVNGTLVSYIFLFSLVGTTASTLVMMTLYYLFRRYFSFMGIGLMGAMASNLCQIALAMVFIFGSQARIMAPLFLITGMVSGLLLGGITELFMKKSEWYREIKVDFQGRIYERST